MSSLNVAILGADASSRASAAQLFGKKASEDDIAFYHGVFSGKIVSAIDPAAYPAKLSSLVESLNLVDLALVIADSPTPALGECIVALDLLGMPTAFVTSTMDLAPFIAQSSLSQSQVFADLNEAKEFILSAETPKVQGSAVVFVDHCFEVKGVGTVALGIVKRGEVKVHDKLSALPLGREIEVKSIQKNDADVNSSEARDRVGLSIKNAKAAEVPRGTVFSARPVNSQKEFECQISLSRFYRLPPLTSGDALHVNAGLQFEPCRLHFEGEAKPGATAIKAKLACEKPIAFESGQKLLLCNLNAKGLRIVGAAVPS